jgi:hypothetical protein
MESELLSSDFTTRQKQRGGKTDCAQLLTGISFRKRL